MTQNAKTPATFTLLVIIFAVFGLEMLIGDAFTYRFAIIPEDVKRGEVWRLITGTFLHAGVLHLFVNTVALYQLGRFFEIMFGTQRFLLVYFACGIAGAVASTWWNVGASVGASGAIFGILGALIFAVRRSPVWRQHRTARSIAGQGIFLLLVNLVITWTVPQIDKAGHIGGLACGLILGWFLPHRIPPPPPAAAVVDVTPLSSRVGSDPTSAFNSPYGEPPADPGARTDDRSWRE